jgi:hypothetical protein
MSLEKGLEGGNNMANHNYSQYSNNGKKNGGKKNPVTEVETMVEEVIETPVEVAAPDVKMEVEPVIETVETKEVPKTVTGTVANCTKLNVRTKPSLTADVVTVITAGEKVTINVDKSNREWFCVAVDNGEHGYTGYCMKKFVTAKL